MSLIIPLAPNKQELPNLTHPADFEPHYIGNNEFYVLNEGFGRIEIIYTFNPPNVVNR